MFYKRDICCYNNLDRFKWAEIPTFINGKGAYTKLSKEVIDKAHKNKAIDRALEVYVPEEIYKELEKIIKELHEKEFFFLFMYVIINKNRGMQYE